MAFLAPSLVALRNEVNARWPNRDKSSDGWIGDAAHSATVSDHNPDINGMVHALDIDEDLDGNQTDTGAELSFLAEYFRGKHDARIKYVIYEARIFAGRNGPSPWIWRPYSGINAHRHHMHISVTYDVVGEHDTSPWLPPLPAPPPTTPPAAAPPEDDDMFVMYHPNNTFWLVTDNGAVEISNDCYGRFTNAGMKAIAPLAEDATAIVDGTGACLAGIADSIAKLTVGNVQRQSIVDALGVGDPPATPDA